MAALGCVALASAGCGGGDDSKSLTKAEYIAKADAICAQLDRATKKYEEQGDALPRDAEVKDFAPAMKGTLAESAKSDARLRELPRPAADKSTLDRFFMLRAQAARVGNQAAQAAAVNDLKAFEKLIADNSQLGPEQTKLAKRYGFKQCAPGD